VGGKEEEEEEEEKKKRKRNYAKALVANVEYRKRGGG
jgi:hypothetical protein